MEAARGPQLKQPHFRGESLAIPRSDRPRLGLLLGAGQHMQPAGGKKRFDLGVIDLDAPGCPLTLIPMSFFGHGISPHPTRPGLIVVFEKRGRGACEIDLTSGRVTRPIETVRNREFYGHGAYSVDGTLLYSAETILEGEHAGVIAVRDARTHDLLGEFPTYSASPHDCRLVDDGATMIITNGGGPMDGIPPSVTFVDVKTEKLLEKLELDTPAINAGHLDVSGHGGLAVVSAQREGLPDSAPGGISLRPPGGGLRTLKEPGDVIPHLTGETLSVCIHEPSGVVATTTPAANLLAFWELASGRLIRSYRIENPRGIALTRDARYFAVSFGFGTPPEAVCLFSTANLTVSPDHALAPTGITGSHVLSCTVPADLHAG